MVYSLNARRLRSLAHPTSGMARFGSMLRAVIAISVMTEVACASPQSPVPLQAVRPQAAPTVEPPHRESAGALDFGEVELPPALISSATSQSPTVFDGLGEFPSYPLPEGEQPPLGPGVFRSGGFAEPLPPSPVWNPLGTKRVGLQVGHWQVESVPNELRRLSPGTSAGGWAEWQINLLIAQHTKAQLEEAGVQVDLLPTTIPPRYRAQAFVSIHADGDLSGGLNGYKIARPGFSSIPETDDIFVNSLYREYGAATGMTRDSDAHISRRMLYYYAFNTRRYEHAIDLGTPSAIVETGFLTHAGDRAFLTGRPEVAARGISNGILRFLEMEIGAPAAR